MRTITKRLAVTLGVSVALLTVATGARASSNGYSPVTPAAAVQEALEMSAAETARNVGGVSSPAGDEQVAMGETVRFDTVWLATVAVICLLLVVRMVHVESAWYRQPAVDRSSWNEALSRDVLTDE